MSDHFTCSICGEGHEGLVTDWGYTIPDDVWEIAEAERAEEAHFNNDLCQFGERNFIRCVLDVPFTTQPRTFGWGAWAEVDRSTFVRYLELYDEDGSSEPTHTGTLANGLSPYASSFGAAVLIQFRDPAKRPSLYLRQEDGSRLAVEQRGGISDARYHEILSIIGQR